ncbi:MAG TPA: hypothetical protein VGF84_04930 [Micromonosporaceae bacterium]|jgi:hypothetical protein
MVATAAAATVLAIATSAQAAVPTVAQAPQKMPTFNGGVYAMAYDGSTIYLGGSFTQVNSGGKKVSRAGLAAVNASTGALLSWAPTANGKVDAMAVDPATHDVYIGGAFSAVNGTSRDSLAEVSGSTGALGAFKHSVTGSALALAVGHGLLYLGGHLTAVDSHARSNLAAFTLSSGALSTAWAPTADDVVYAITPTENRVYLGGKFHKIDSVSGTAKLAAVNPTTGAHDGTFKPSVAVLVYSIAVGPNGVFAAEGGQGGRAIEYSSAGAIMWTFTTDGDVQALTYLNGVLYVGGHFDNACKSASTGAHGFCIDGSIPRVKLAAVDASSGTLTDWNPTGNGIHGVFSMASSSSLGAVAAGGEFTTIQGASRGRFAQFH